jgi:hypothetical protein
VKVVGAAAMPKGLFAEVNGLGAISRACVVAGVYSGAVVYSGAAGGAAELVADGANENGELGELKIEGTAGCGGGWAGGTAVAGGSGVVNGSGYCGIEFAASENGFAPGRYCDCCAGCQSGVTGGASGAGGDHSASGAFSWPGGGGTRPSATRRGSSIH